MKKYQDYTKEQLIKVIEEKNITISRLNGELYYRKDIEKKFNQYKKSKQASYEKMQRLWKETELENRNIKRNNKKVAEMLDEIQKTIDGCILIEKQEEFVLLTEENTVEQLLFPKEKFVEYVNKHLCKDGEKVEDPEEAIEFASEMSGFTIDVLTLECEV